MAAIIPGGLLDIPNIGDVEQRPLSLQFCPLGAGEAIP